MQRASEALLPHFWGSATYPRPSAVVTVCCGAVGEYEEHPFWFVLPSGVGQQGVSEPEFVLPGTGGSHCDLHPPYTDAHEGADLQQLQPDRAAGGLGELGMNKPDPAQRAEQHI
jgi:hypothetical protein